jgi:hypothetical protein
LHASYLFFSHHLFFPSIILDLNHRSLPVNALASIHSNVEVDGGDGGLDTNKTAKKCRPLLSRRNWDSPTPYPQASVPPFPFGSGGGGHTRLRGRGVGEFQFRRARGDVYCGTLYILYKYFVLNIFPSRSGLTSQKKDLWQTALRIKAYG